MLMRSLVLLVLILSTMGEGVQLNNVLQLFYHTCIGSGLHYQDVFINN
jgi:hypothetical protein